MKYKISVLVSGTTFTYQSKKYVLGMFNSDSNYNPDFLGNRPEKDKLAFLKDCNPILGGKTQSGIVLYINKETEVDVD